VELGRRFLAQLDPCGWLKLLCSSSSVCSQLLKIYGVQGEGVISVFVVILSVVGLMVV